MSPGSPPTTRTPGWALRAPRPSTFRLEAVLRIDPTLYVGPANGFTPAEWETAREPLPMDGLTLIAPIAGSGGWLAAGDARAESATFEALVRHGRALVGAAERNAIALTYARPSRIRPMLWADGKPVCRFTWCDDLAHTRRILDRLRADAAGVLYDDMDQGWAIHIVRSGADVVFGESDGALTKRPARSCVVAFTEIARAAEAAEDALDDVLARLRREGADAWSV